MVKLFSTRVPRPFNKEKAVLSLNGIRQTGYSHRKEHICTLSLWHIQKLAQHGHKCKSEHYKTPRKKHRGKAS